MQVGDNTAFYSAFDAMKSWVIKQVAGGRIPASLFYQGLTLPPLKMIEDDAPFSLEIVSHCWQYAHLLRYQLSSLVLYAPPEIKLTITVYYCKSDQVTVDTLRYFETFKLTNIQWNWQSFDKEYLFRRSIGRNHAALNTQADWIWFTDCDSIFYQNCLRSLAKQLRKHQTPLVFPLFEHRSHPLAPDHQYLSADSRQALVDIHPQDFTATAITRATGPLQIVHGDVARKLGYCKQSALYQKPALHWCKALEDRVFRWFLGTQGQGMHIEGVYRLQHQQKGRYATGSCWSWFRQRAQAIKTQVWQAKAKSTQTATTQTATTQTALFNYAKGLTRYAGKK